MKIKKYDVKTVVEQALEEIRERINEDPYGDFESDPHCILERDDNNDVVITIKDCKEGLERGEYYYSVQSVEYTENADELGIAERAEHNKRSLTKVIRSVQSAAYERLTGKRKSQENESR